LVTPVTILAALCRRTAARRSQVRADCEADLSEPLRLLIAISGAEDPAFVGFVARVVAAGGPPVDLTLLHAVDAEARMLAGEGLAMRHAPWPRLRRARPIAGSTKPMRQAPRRCWPSGRSVRGGVSHRGGVASVVRRGRPEQCIVRPRRIWVPMRSS